MGPVATMINRGNEKGIEKALLEKLQFSTFNKWDVNYKKINNQDRYFKSKTQKDCSDLANDILSGKPIKVKRKFSGATNYFVSKGDPKIHTYFKDAKKFKIPGWAYLKQEDGKTFRLKDGKRIPIEYLAKVPTKLNRKLYTYIYKF